MSIPSWARVGAKVVCITQAVSPLALRHNHPKKNGIYTVRSVCMCDDGNPAFLLEECVNFVWDPMISQREPGFGVKHFRPLITQSDDISAHFQQFLNVRENA